MRCSVEEPTASSDLSFVNVKVGRIMRFTVDGHPLVDFPGNLLGSLEARSMASTAPLLGRHECINLPVLLVFENGDPGLPIIVGFVADTFLAQSYQEDPNVSVDGKTIVFNATCEIVLQSGKSSLTLRSDGKIVIKGAKIVSRSSGEQKIRGASVQLN
jgi:hypothetical protein